MIVDAHMHIWNRIHGQIGKGIPVRPLERGMIRIEDRDVLGMPAYMYDCAAYAEYVIGEFDAAGVDAGVVVQEYLDGPQNDYLLEVSANYGDRFFMHALPNVWDLSKVEREAHELFSSGFRGLKLSAQHLLDEIRLDDLKLMPIWAAMEQQGFVLAVDLSEGQAQVSEMRNILERHTNLKVALGHLGMPNRGGWPGQLRLAEYPNVYIDAGGLTWLYRDEGFPFPGALDALRHACDEIGVEKVMWGSDWPRTTVDFSYHQTLDFLRHTDRFSNAEKQQLLGDNAARLYDLSLPKGTARMVRSRITEG